MNNEKLILEALSFLLVVNHPISDEARDKRLEIINKIDQVLNPKEDVPYEDSLKDQTLGLEFVKSSPKENNEKEMYCCIEGCGKIDETQTAYCIEHGRSPHKMREVAKSSTEEKKNG